MIMRLHTQWLNALKTHKNNLKTCFQNIIIWQGAERKTTTQHIQIHWTRITLFLKRASIFRLVFCVLLTIKDGSVRLTVDDGQRLCRQCLNLIALCIVTPCFSNSRCIFLRKPQAICQIYKQSSARYVMNLFGDHAERFNLSVCAPTLPRAFHRKL